MASKHRRNRFWEIWKHRYLGHTVAVPLVVLLLFLLTLIEIRRRDAVEPEPMRITMEFQQPEPEPEPIEEEPPEEEQIEELDPIPFDQVVATRVDSPEDESELILDPVEGQPEQTAEELVTEEITPPPAAPVEDWVPTTDQMADLRALESEVARETSSLEREATELRESIIRREVSSAARDFELDTDGGTHGAIRLLKLDGFPDHVVEDVLARYRITFERRHASPSAGRGFLNAAQTQSGTFRNVQREGIYDVLVLSTYAMTYMASREIEALQRKGYDPATTRVRKIVFGIVMNSEDEYDLGVVDLEVERVR